MEGKNMIVLTGGITMSAHSESEHEGEGRGGDLVRRGHELVVSQLLSVGQTLLGFKFWTAVCS